MQAQSCVHSSTVIHSRHTASPQKLLGQSKPNFIWNRHGKVCVPHLGHMIKIAAMPIYGKSPLNFFFSSTKGPVAQ